MLIFSLPCHRTSAKYNSVCSHCAYAARVGAPCRVELLGLVVWTEGAGGAQPNSDRARLAASRWRSMGLPCDGMTKKGDRFIFLL